MLNVASSLTGRKYPEDTFIVATSGRCEYRNKGIDVYLDAVKKLAESKPSRQVIAFVMVPAWSREPRADLKGALGLKRKKSLVDPVITHWLNNPDSDPVIGRIHELGFNTVETDHMTVIYVPCYLNGTDGIFDKSYYELLIGMDATVFASYYEPWGYTPLESVAFGVPTVTTSLSGFGQWIINCFGEAPAMEDCGVNVVRRTDGNYGEVVDSIEASLGHLLAPDTDVTAIHEAARETAAMAAWSYFVDYYVLAFNMAVENAAERNH